MTMLIRKSQILSAIVLVYMLSYVLSCPTGHIKEENPEEGDFYEGDINLSPLNFENELGGVASQNLSLKWPNAKKQSENIRKGMEHIRDETMINGKLCINFVPRDGHKDYIKIDSRKGCWSSLGRQTGAQILSLESPDCVRSKGIPVHELLHALGFYHEQSRPDRDKFVIINKLNIKPDKRNNFKKYSNRSVDTLGTPYDYDSIMHYRKDAFSRNNSATIVPRQNVTIGQRKGLSKIDIEEIRKYYGCK